MLDRRGFIAALLTIAIFPKSFATTKRTNIRNGWILHEEDK
jgi:hypothetical protein